MSDSLSANEGDETAKIIVCSDISMMPATARAYHCGIGLAFYSGDAIGECLIHQVSHYCQTSTTSQVLEYRAIRMAIRELLNMRLGHGADVVVVSDSKEAIRQWRMFANGPIPERPRMLTELQAKARSLTFVLERADVRRAHQLARAAALTHIQTQKAQQERANLVRLLNLEA